MMNILEVGFRIKQSIGLTGYNVKEFCEKTERSRVTTALWISGRGGLIKDKSLEELCFDLKKCYVQCTSNWLKYGTGASPALIPTESSTYIENNSRLYKLNINVDEILLHLKKNDTDSYFEVNNQYFYAIAEVQDLIHLIKKTSNTLILLAAKNEDLIGYIEGHCSDTNTLVFRSLRGPIRCLSCPLIKKIGKVTTYINKFK